MWRTLNGEALALGLDLDIGATLTPFEDTFHGNPLYGYYDEVKEKKHQAVNEWIRKSSAFDGGIDFDAVTRDPVNPKHILPAMIRAITFTRKIPATRRWPTRLT